MTREEAQEALTNALQVQSAAKARLALAVAAVATEKANVMDADADVMKAKAALARLGGPVVAEGASKTNQSDLCAAVTKVLQASAAPMTVDQILAAVQAEGVVLSGAKPRENLNAYIARWSKVPGATIVSKGRGLWGAAGAPALPEFLTVNQDGMMPAPEVPAFLAAPETVDAPVTKEPTHDSDVAPTPLPEDFPGREALTEAGYTTRESLEGKTHDQLRRIKGVGAGTARDILSVLNPSEA